MQISKTRIAMIALALFALGVGAIPPAITPAEAHSSRNWTQSQRSNYCSTRAERHANRHVRRTTAAGALTGAGIGSITSGSRRNASRNAGRGALIGGGAGLLTSNSRWTSYYNRYYRNCVRW